MSFARPAFLVLCLAATPGTAADFSDPTWPCIQRKVENLSLGLMWPLPVDRALAEGDLALERDVAELAETLVLRRIPLENLQGQVDDFAAKHDGNADTLGLVFARVFDTISKRRTRIIKGIGDFSLGQIALAEKIDMARAEIDTLMAASKPDFDRVDVLEEQIDWDQVIHTDRQRSITYLCETPTLLERRLFGIAQMLQQAIRDDG